MNEDVVAVLVPLVDLLEGGVLRGADVEYSTLNDVLAFASDEALFRVNLRTKYCAFLGKSRIFQFPFSIIVLKKLIILIFN